MEFPISAYDRPISKYRRRIVESIAGYLREPNYRRHSTAAKCRKYVRKLTARDVDRKIDRLSCVVRQAAEYRFRAAENCDAFRFTPLDSSPNEFNRLQRAATKKWSLIGSDLHRP